MFTCSSSGISKLFGLKFRSKYVTFCSHLPFSKCARFMEFFRCGGVLAWMICSVMARAATSNPSLTSYKILLKYTETFAVIDWIHFFGVSALLWPLSKACIFSQGKLLENLPDSLRLDSWCFWTSATHHISRDAENICFYHLHSTDSQPFGSFGRDLKAVEISQISRQRWALLWWVT